MTREEEDEQIKLLTVRMMLLGPDRDGADHVWWNYMVAECRSGTSRSYPHWANTMPTLLARWQKDLAKSYRNES